MFCFPWKASAVFGEESCRPWERTLMDMFPASYSVVQTPKSQRKGSFFCSTDKELLTCMTTQILILNCSSSDILKPLQSTVKFISPFPPSCLAKSINLVLYSNPCVMHLQKKLSPLFYTWRADDNFLHFLMSRKQHVSVSGRRCSLTGKSPVITGESQGVNQKGSNDRTFLYFSQLLGHCLTPCLPVRKM